jgi:hypothetical protein
VQRIPSVPSAGLGPGEDKANTFRPPSGRMTSTAARRVTSISTPSTGTGTGELSLSGRHGGTGNNTTHDIAINAVVAVISQLEFNSSSASAEALLEVCCGFLYFLFHYISIWWILFIFGIFIVLGQCQMSYNTYSNHIVFVYFPIIIM